MDELLKNHIFTGHVIAAMGSLTLGTALTYPLDTIKSLIQVWSLIPNFLDDLWLFEIYGSEYEYDLF